MRDELALAAARVLSSRGFEETTVDEIAASVGVSRRTFFRYFQSKEDVVVHIIARAGTAVCSELESRPAGEPAAAALRQALSPCVRISVEEPIKTLGVARRIFSSETLVGRFLERLTQWQADISSILARRAGLDARVDPRPDLVAGIALTAFHLSFRRWAEEEGESDLGELLDAAFALIEPALRLPGGTD